MKIIKIYPDFTWTTGSKKLLLFCILFQTLALPIYMAGAGSPANTVTQEQQNKASMIVKPPFKWGDFVLSSVLFIGGSYLTWKQLPRLSGQQIEFKSPIFTKIVASILCALGIAGGTVGSYKLFTQLRDYLNDK
jgi:hypothetical protein